MIKTILLITTAGILALIMGACSNTASATPVAKKEEVADFRCKQENTLAPKWTCIPILEGYYAGVGIAKKSKAGMSHMRRIATANGRSDLAQQIKSQVKDKVETFTRTTGNGDAETVDAVSTSVSKQVAKVDLQGSKAVDSWVTPSGTLYLLVTVSEATVNGTVKNAVKTSFKNDEALWQQFQSKNALDKLDQEFPDK